MDRKSIYFDDVFRAAIKLAKSSFRKWKKYNKWPKPRSALKIMIAFRGQTLLCFRSYARCIKSKSLWTTIIGISPYICCPLRAPVLCNEVETPYTIVYCIQHNTSSANCRDGSGPITEDYFVMRLCCLHWKVNVMKQTCHYHL